MSEIIVVASGKGGVGKSTFVHGISSALTELGCSVLAIDCDIGLRSLDLLFGCGGDVVFDWGDIINERCSAEDAILTTANGSLIAAPRTFSGAFTSDNLKKLVDSLKEDYDYIFLDAPAGIDSGFALAASCAEKAIAVTTPDSVCVRSCSRACEELENLGVNDIRMIINMFEAKPVSKRKLLNIDECIDETCVQLLGVVPMDRALAFSCVTGEEPGEFSPSDQAFYRISRRMRGERIPLVCE